LVYNRDPARPTFQSHCLLELCERLCQFVTHVLHMWVCCRLILSPFDHLEIYRPENPITRPPAKVPTRHFGTIVVVRSCCALTANSVRDSLLKRRALRLAAICSPPCLSPWIRLSVWLITPADSVPTSHIYKNIITVRGFTPFRQFLGQSDSTTYDPIHLLAVRTLCFFQVCTPQVEAGMEIGLLFTQLDSVVSQILLP